MNDSYFDEAIFTHGETLLDFPKINVYNKADAFLVAKQNIEVGNACASIETSQQASDSIAVNLNPRGLCMGINIYSMNPTNKKIKKLVNFNQISVFDGESPTPIDIAEYKPNQIYTVGSLTALESAIMLKYYAINNPNVYITRHLYLFVKKYFQDSRAWFNYKSIGIVQNHNRELVMDDEILNVPIVTFYSDPININ
ncbi:GrBNV_gp97-like protein [Oryctes rhinoceros nudivirus]|uniref:GrBNV_gp97-like protein n=1 Tax=Oryctes rhinoceros nudivirus TaxID=92521 RepID=A3QTZ0_9VIRU|nr:GrBNV_gp97-like protein [Oryctes rhinoceros nudivirus]ABF93327.1 unknown [Oryctes rhinoceros nudivirus]ACH96174.1 GrBNV_gp97-like protein [Oryctes rhinoceros nudivirus]QHG11282.1 GrBNV_gp97-like protein [Oryctes rhinoceros nudivirus]QKE59517.1 GrBNV_gp97-like protein [Oryctes rhinoceros nudivirus]UBO76464.1 GrBNV_gp97-like protein [Oryctes rhinoceros nudivirus]